MPRVRKASSPSWGSRSKQLGAVQEVTQLLPMALLVHSGQMLPAPMTMHQGQLLLVQLTAACRDRLLQQRANQNFHCLRICAALSLGSP